MKLARYALERHRKLSAFVLAAGLLLGGLFVKCSDARYEAFSLAVAGLGSALIGAHAWQRAKTATPAAAAAQEEP